MIWKHILFIPGFDEYYPIFVCTQLNVFKYIYLSRITLFNIYQLFAHYEMV